MPVIDTLSVLYDVQDAKAKAGFRSMATASKATTQQIAVDAGRVEKSFNSMNGSVGNLAAQFNDVGVTAASGMSPLLIALQQGTQLSQVFAAQGGNLRSTVSSLGAAFASIVSPVSLVTIGLTAVAAVAIQAATNLFSSGDAAETLQDKIEGLQSAVDNYRSAVDAANLPTAELAEKYGIAAFKAEELLGVLSRMARIEAATAIKSGIDAISESMGGAVELLQRYDQVLAQGYSEEESAALRSQRKLNEEFGLSIEKARELVVLLQDQRSASTVDEKANAARRLSQFLNEASLAANDQNEALLSAANAASQVALAAYQISEATDDAARGTNDLSNEMSVAEGGANNVAAAVASIDFSNAIGAAQSLSGVIGGLVGQAQGLISILNAAGAASSAVKNIGGGALSGAKSIIGAAYEKAQERLQDIESNNLGQRPASRPFDVSERAAYGPVSSGGGGRKSGGGGAGSKRAESPFFGDIEKDLSNLQRQIDLVGKSNQEVATAKARWELLDEAKKRGVPVNDTLNAQIEAQAGKFGELTAALEQGKISQQQFEQQIDGISGAMSQALFAGESLRESLANVFAQLAVDIGTSGIKNAILSQFSGLGGGGSGGGLFSNLLGSLFGGFRANGGPVSSGKAYVVGERGPELMVPNMNGTVLNQSQLGKANQAPKIIINNNAPGVDVSTEYATHNEVKLMITKGIAVSNQRQDDTRYLRGA